MHLLRPVLAVTLAAGAALAGTPASAAEVYYRSCAEVRAAGKAPLRAGEPGYRPGLDRDKDGTACDTGRTTPIGTSSTATSTTTASATATATKPTVPTVPPKATVTPPVVTAPPPKVTATPPIATATRSGTSTATGTTTQTRTTRPDHPGVGSGLHQVRRDLRPGLYRTAGDGPNHCSWYRLRANDGEFASIIAVDLFRGPGSVTVKAGDRFVKFSGGCTWRRDGGGNGSDGRDSGGRDSGGRDSDDRDSDGRGGRDGSDSDDGDGDRSSSSGSSSGSRPGVYTQVAASDVPVGGIETGS